MLFSTRLSRILLSLERTRNTKKIRKKKQKKQKPDLDKPNPVGKSRPALIKFS